MIPTWEDGRGGSLTLTCILQEAEMKRSSSGWKEVTPDSNWNLHEKIRHSGKDKYDKGKMAIYKII